MKPNTFSRMWIAALAGLFIVMSGTLPLRAVPITALAFSPDGAALVSNGDRRIDVRSPKDATVQRNVVCDLAKITSLAFAPGGRLLAVGGGEPGVDGEVILFSWPEAKVLHRMKNHTDVVSHVTFDAAGKRLGVASIDHSARVWKLDENAAPALAFTLNGHAGPVLAIAFSPSGQSVVTASADRSLKVWAADDGRLLRSFGHHTESIHALSFRPQTGDGDGPVACATAGEDRTVRIWQPEIGRMVRIVRQHGGPVFALAWSRDAATLFSAGKEGVIRCIDGGSDAILAEWPAHDDWIYSLAVSPDGSTLASGDWSGSVRIHDLRRNETQPPLPDTPKKQ